MKFEKIPDSEYFALPRLSASGIRRLLMAPAKFMVPMEQTPAMKLGSHVHCRVLERHAVASRYAIAPQVDKRTTDGKKTWAEFSAQYEGKDVEIVSLDDSAKAKAIADAVLSHEFYGMTVEQFLKHPATQTEVAILWDQEFDGVIVPCKCKVDAVNTHYKVILDLKTTSDASPDAFRRKLYGELDGYYLQSTFYRLPAITAGFKFHFLVVETSEPFCSGIYTPDPAVTDEAMAKIAEAAELWHHGQTTGVWSRQYNVVPQELAPAGWFWMKQ